MDRGLGSASSRMNPENHVAECLELTQTLIEYRQAKALHRRLTCRCGKACHLGILWLGNLGRSLASLRADRHQGCRVSADFAPGVGHLAFDVERSPFASSL